VVRIGAAAGLHEGYGGGLARGTRSSRPAKVEGRDTLLDSGLVLRSRVLFDRRGKRLPMERLQKIFTRWYGFTLTFSGSEVFGQ